MEIDLEGLKITDYFQRGTAVKTQTENSIEWVPNVVFDTYSNKNEIGVIFDERYSKVVIFAGDSIKLNYPVGKTQYFMETSVTGIRVEAVKIMTLRIKSIKQIPNLREHERYSINYAAEVYSFSEVEKRFASITNISLSGLGFVSKYSYFIGDKISISIAISDASFEIEGEIVRCNETVKGDEYGIKFIRQDDKIKAELKSLIESIKEREDSLSRIVGFNIY